MLTIEHAGLVAVMTPDRPERKNSVTGAKWDEIADALAAIENDHDVRAVVLTGGGGDSAPVPTGSQTRTVRFRRSSRCNGSTGARAISDAAASSMRRLTYLTN